MERRIGKKFQELKSRGAKAFIPFIMAGDPDLETTIRLVPELERAGSHIVEFGIPFSDPVADGPVIQRAGSRALIHRYSMSDYLRAIEAIRKRTEVPLLLFSYFNPILQYGLETLARDARAAGADGILVTDIIPEEADQYCACMEANEMDCVFLAAPTSGEDRVARIAKCSSGFVYVVSRTGVTGVQQQLSGSVAPTVERVRKFTKLPVAVGFGISRPEQVQAVWDISDGAVVGSAIVAEMERTANPQEIPTQIGKFCRWLTGTP
ncbi:MAG TPA: tryptophan synthase subunit alpha [Acidobacteriota bacterium]|nr:tryptophan synthase subunit alpha [Acidobacteriota bacterium]